MVLRILSNRGNNGQLVRVALDKTSGYPQGTKTILLDHGQGLITMYCHMSEYMVEEGEFIDQGQMLGLVGSTGRSTGPHLHWSVSLNNFRIDPLEFLPAVNQALK